jgi:hypothetical protein
MRRKLVALALAALVVTGCEGAFRCDDKGGGGGPSQEQPAGDSETFQGG